MLGIEPSHMDELRQKEGLRLVIEERLLEVRDLIVAAFQVVEYLALSVVTFGKFLVSNRKYVGTLLFVLAVTAILLF